MLIADKDRTPEDFFKTLRTILESVFEPETKPRAEDSSSTASDEEVKLPVKDVK